MGVVGVQWLEGSGGSAVEVVQWTEGSAVEGVLLRCFKDELSRCQYASACVSMSQHESALASMSRHSRGGC